MLDIWEGYAIWRLSALAKLSEMPLDWPRSEERAQL